MTVYIKCDRSGCDVIEEAPVWYSKVISGVAAVEADLPAGWEIDVVGHDEVIHCPDHVYPDSAA